MSLSSHVSHVLNAKIRIDAVVLRTLERCGGKPLRVHADQQSEIGEFDVVAGRRDEPVTTIRNRDRRGASLDHNPAAG